MIPFLRFIRSSLLSVMCRKMLTAKYAKIVYFHQVSHSGKTFRIKADSVTIPHSIGAIEESDICMA
jgi:hypothetical protein